MLAWGSRDPLYDLDVSVYWYVAICTPNDVSLEVELTAN